MENFTLDRFAQLHVAFVSANEAADRAVLSSSDDTAAAAAKEAKDASSAAVAHLEALEPILQSLGYADAIGYLGGFKTKFAEAGLDEKP